MKVNEISLKYIILLELWLMFLAIDHGLSIYITLGIAGIVTLPLLVWEVQLAKTLLSYSSLCLVLATALLMRVDFGESVFFCFIHFELIRCLNAKSFYTIPVILMETYSIFWCPVDQFMVFLLGLNLFGCLSVCMLLEYNVGSMFTGGSTFFAAFLSILTSKTVNIPTFVFSCLLSLPRLPFPISPKRISDKNMRMIRFSIVSFTMNFIGFFYGIHHQALAVQSSALKSMSNNIAMFAIVIANLSARDHPDSKFSYGFIRSQVVGGFAVTILLIYFSYDCFCATLLSLLQPTDPQRTTTGFFILTLAIFTLNSVGTFYLGTIDRKTCSIADGVSIVPLVIDMIVSTFELVATFLSYVFGVEGIDSWATLATSVTLFAISLPRLKLYIPILLETNQKHTDIDLSDLNGIEIIDCTVSQLGLNVGTIANIRAVTTKLSFSEAFERILRKFRMMGIEYSSIEITPTNINYP